MLTIRALQRDELPLIWTINRAEIIERIYYLVDGALELRPERFVVTGWPPGEIETYSALLTDCFDRGGWFLGAFDGPTLAAAAVLESRFIGPKQDQLQLKFLHTGQAYRGQGLGQQLFEQASAEARSRGARQLYVSATPSENTINFYLRRGCRVTAHPDPELFALEPEDIHLECDL
jgi:predicted N-acetyltransferase YhbS